MGATWFPGPLLSPSTPPPPPPSPAAATAAAPCPLSPPSTAGPAAAPTSANARAQPPLPSSLSCETESERRSWAEREIIKPLKEKKQLAECWKNSQAGIPSPRGSARLRTFLKGPLAIPSSHPSSWECLPRPACPRGVCAPSGSCVLWVRAELGWEEEGRATGNREGKGLGRVGGRTGA